MKRISLLGAGIAAIASLIAIPAVHAQQAQGPTVPDGISASINQSNQVYVSWNASTDPLGVQGYYLYRNGQLIANTPGLTYYTDPVPAGVYTYTVSAYDGSGYVSGLSAPTPSITVTADTTPPTAPTALTATATTSSIQLAWNGSTDNFGVIGYYLYRNGVAITTAQPIQGTTYTDTDVSQGMVYTYSVAAYDSSGNISAHASPVSAKLIYDVVPPSVPSPVFVKVVSPTEADLTWGAATDNVGVTGYEIFENGAVIATVSSSPLFYAATDLQPGTSYNFSVGAIDAAGNESSPDIQIGATTLPPDTTPPSIPTNFYGKAVSASEVDLSWSPSIDNVGVAGYNVFRDNSQIATVNGTTTVYADTGLATSTLYNYEITAFDAAGNVSPQQSLAVTTLATNPVIQDETSASGTSKYLNGSSGTGVASGGSASGSTTVATGSNAGSGGGAVFMTTLAIGSRGSIVVALQQALIRQGDLGAQYATGYFGALTQAAVQRFQCAENIVCSGSSYTTGWGMVGPKTRGVLNSL